MKKYFYSQVKRVVRFLPIILVISMVLCVLVSIIFSAMLSIDENKKDKQKFAIGVVGDTKESFLGSGISALENFDSSRFAIEFVELDEEKAKSSLQKGEISAYAVVPDDFVNSLVHGEIKKIKYYTTDDGVGISAVFEKEVTQVISNILVQSQKGVYGLADAMEDNGASYCTGEKMNELCAEYFELIINRTSMGKNEYIGIADEVSMQGYFLCSIITLFVFLFGISCVSMYAKRDISLNRILNAKGQSGQIQIICEYFTYFLLVYLVVFVTSVCVAALGGLKSLIPELEYMGMSEILLFTIRIIPVVAMISAFHFLLFEITRDIVTGVLLQFVASVSLTYISGCFYPIYFFPEIVQRISTFLPAGLARSYLSEIIVQKPITISFVFILIYFVLFLGVTILVRNRRIKGRG